MATLILVEGEVRSDRASRLMTRSHLCGKRMRAAIMRVEFALTL